jgi:hypothetical protein
VKLSATEIVKPSWVETQRGSVKFNTRISYKETKHFNCTEMVFESHQISTHFSSAEMRTDFRRFKDPSVDDFP